MIIGRLKFNQLCASLSTFYLCMKYPLSNGQVGVIQGDQEIAKKCYVECLKLKRVCTLGLKVRNIVLGIKPPKKPTKVRMILLRLVKRSKIEGPEGMPFGETCIIITY